MGKDIDAIPARFADGADIGRLQWESPKLIFRAADRARIPELIPMLAERGALWIDSLKGKLLRIKDVEVMAAAKAHGLVDNKVCAFSDTRTAPRSTRRR